MLMMHRRNFLTLSAGATLAAALPRVPVTETVRRKSGPFRFCLNMSTISGQQPGLLHGIDIAAAAGYDGVELWIKDIHDWLAGGNTIAALHSHLQEKNITVENAISFTAWLSDDEAARKTALVTLEEEMLLMAAIGCHRIAAPPFGLPAGQVLDIEKAGERYRQTLGLGRKHGVMPLLEFWGPSPVIHNFSQALAIAAAANDSDARILPDVYHLFRGGSGFESLSLVSGHVIDIIHMNDYPAGIPIAALTDADRVYPGDGAAPYRKILSALKKMGGPKTLSLELFNKQYWSQDPLAVARTGLQKMQKLVTEVMA